MASTKHSKVEYKTTFEKILFVLQIILSIAVIILSSLELSDILTLVDGITEILMAGIFFIIFIQYRKYNKLKSYLSLAISLFLFLIFGISNIFI